MSTASKAVPGMVFSASISASSQRRSAAPETNHGEPLSATIIP